MPNYLKVEPLTKTQLQTALLSGALMLAGWVAAVDPAAAAVYRGRFDPLYGAPFKNPPLAWSGKVDIFVPNDCDQSNSTLNPFNCGGIEILRASVDLYETELDSDESNCLPDPWNSRACKRIGSTITQMVFDPSSGLQGVGWSLTFDGDEVLTQVVSTAFAPIQPDAGILTDWNGTDQAWFSLKFIGESAQLFWFDKKPDAVELLALTNEFFAPLGDDCRLPGTTTIDPFPKRGIFKGDIYGGNTCGWSQPAADSDGALLTFSLVPEPTTYALVPAALAIMGLVGVRTRRRRSACLTQ